MANFDLLVVGSGGKQQRKPSSAQAIDFSSVRIGAGNLTISEDTGKFDFQAKVLGNIANGTASGQALSFSQIGAANGVAGLDGGGKVPVAQLPNSIMEYQGVYDAATDSPALEDGTGSAGDVYRVSVAGTQDFGAGNISFEIGDYVIYNGAEWEKADMTDAVSSVNGLQGVVVLNTDHIDEDGSPTNLYFTEARAQAASISQVITNGVTTKAPSEDAVFDALANKSDVGHSHVAADISDFDAEALDAAVQSGAITDGATKAPTHDAVFDALALKANAADVALSHVSKTNDNAGTISVRQVVYVKSNGAVDLADASAVDLFDGVIGLVKDATILTTAAGLITFAKGDIISGFSGLTPGKKYYVSNDTAGGIDLYADITFVAGESVCRVGKALSATELEFDPGFEFEY